MPKDKILELVKRTETLTILGTTYTDPQGGTYQLVFDDSGGTSHTEDFLLWSTGSNFIFAPLPGSSFDGRALFDRDHRGG